MLSSDELKRYRRHLLLKEIGGPGQQRLKAGSVLLIGAGGLGSPAALYLAAAGIGRLGIVDDDTVSLDNLQRQIAFRTSNVGERKAEIAAQAAQAINPHVILEPHPVRLTAANAMGVIEGYDVVLDGSDNFATRYLVNDACYFAKKPLVFGALGQFDGYVSTFRAFENDASGVPYPSYRCLFPEPPPEGTVANCEEAGVLGPVAGVIGTLMAVEAIKELTGAGTSLAGRLLIYDALSSRFETIALRWDPANPLNGERPALANGSHHAASVAVAPAS
jgi:adenylyltransferase/sulfurtransferase